MVCILSLKWIMQNRMLIWHCIFKLQNMQYINVILLRNFSRWKYIFIKFYRKFLSIKGDNKNIGRTLNYVMNNYFVRRRINYIVVICSHIYANILFCRINNGRIWPFYNYKLILFFSLLRVDISHICSISRYILYVCKFYHISLFFIHFAYCILYTIIFLAFPNVNCTMFQ